MIVTSII